jgi:hypothetical protein
MPVYTVLQSRTQQTLSLPELVQASMPPKGQPQIAQAMPMRTKPSYYQAGLDDIFTQSTRLKFPAEHWRA